MIKKWRGGTTLVDILDQAGIIKISAPVEPSKPEKETAT
jgi:hypothetical protein